MNKRVFIIHGWDGFPEEGWFPWLKQELEKIDYEIIVPAMPNPNEPKIEAWVDHLDNIVGEPDENTFFVGHSIGVQAILRYLETIGNRKIGGAVFVAGWFILQGLGTEEEEEIAAPWVDAPIDFERIKKTTHKFTAIFSDNDPYVDCEVNSEIFKEKLGAEIIIENDMHHFSGNDGIKELPSVLKVLTEV